MTTTTRRDALLAALVSGGLLTLLVSQNAVGALASPVAITGGVAGALVVELAFLRSTTVQDLWRRPIVQVGSTAAVLAAGTIAYTAGGAVVIAALCWGLATYFVLLGAVVVFGTNPLAGSE